jgi:transcriptional regulator with XRE-family HTH domain
MLTTTPATPAESPLRALLRQKGLSQERCAALAGLSRGWVSFLTRNPEAMTPTSAERLARVLHCRPADLMP